MNSGWNTMDTIPIGKLVLVYSRYRGYGLRYLIKGKYIHTWYDTWYDANDYVDDSGIKWEGWRLLPDEME